LNRPTAVSESSVPITIESDGIDYPLYRHPSTADPSSTRRCACSLTGCPGRSGPVASRP
jgi:hypothetical protein